MKNFISKLPPYVALFVMLASLCLVMCVPATDPIEREYNEGRQSDEGKQSEEKEVIVNTAGIDFGGNICTKIYEADGYRYRIFWMGDGGGEASLVVINLDEQEARINYYRANTTVQP